MNWCKDKSCQLNKNFSDLRHLCFRNDKNEIHNENGPAIIFEINPKSRYPHMSGAKYWYIDGLPHSENGPARISNEGTFWIVKGIIIK